MSSSVDSTPYRVLARKYRPRHFDELVGQDALVRTLKNAITSGRIAQAYMLTGVRGVGKTTTARIIARAINYVGPDGKGGPTIGPTDDCPVCQSIAEGRHPDVIEMDAASHTGVDDVREVIEAVRYAPASARYKVYIIDEVHMLSKQAFNALLKTLEEPPAHAKFIFATTEIRKVPVTILSRCQRFDLRRLETQELADYFKKVCAWEKVEAEDAAIAMIARAAGGSVRDGLSILDQAIALGQGAVTGESVANMLGLADEGRVVDLFAAAVTGKTPQALDQLGDLYKLGADPQIVIDDLLALAHKLLRALVTNTVPGLDHGALRDLAGQLGVPMLSRAWQILLKSLNDFAHAPNPLDAAEMAIIRLAYAATLPDPGRLMKQLAAESAVPAAPLSKSAAAVRTPEPVARRVVGGGAVQTETPVMVAAEPARLQNLQAMAAALEESGQVMLASQVAHFVHVIKFEVGRLECRLAEGAPMKLPNELGSALQALTGQRWIISLAKGEGAPTLYEQSQAADRALQSQIESDPLVQQVLQLFPGTTIETIIPQSGEP